MLFEFHRPGNPLSLFVDSFTYYRDYYPTHNKERLLPDGNVNLIFEFTEQPKYIYDNETLEEIQTCRKAWFSGIRNTPITIPSGRDSQMFIIQFKKGMALPFSKIPMVTVSNEVLDAEEAMGPEILDLRDALQELTSPFEMFSLAERKLNEIYGGRFEVCPVVEYSLMRINKNPNTLTLKRLNSEIGYSQKHFIELFKNRVGVTPKTYLRIMRFQKAIHDIDRQTEINWTELALDAGYFDQAHFIHDFKFFCGFTPKQYQQQIRLFQNYIAVD